MKRSSLLFLFILIAHFTNAQDLITLKSGDVIAVRVIDIFGENIRYLDHEDPDGDIMTIPVSEVYMIVYSTGRREYFSTEPPPSPPAIESITEPEPDQDLDISPAIEPDATDRPTTDAETIEPERTLDTYQAPIETTAGFARTSRTTFFDVGYQHGSIRAVNMGIGVFFNDIIFSINYARSHQDYASSLFRSSRKQEVVFNQAAIGVGYNFKIQSSGNLPDIFINPMVLGGIELANNDRLLNDNSISFLMNYYVKPQLLVGVNYQRFDFFAGTNYTTWLTPGMTDQRYGMKSGETGSDVKWAEDLFLDRKGITVVLGTRIHLFNY